MERRKGHFCHAKVLSSLYLLASVCTVSPCHPKKWIKNLTYLTKLELPIIPLVIFNCPQQVLVIWLGLGSRLYRWHKKWQLRNNSWPLTIGASMSTYKMLWNKVTGLLRKPKSKLFQNLRRSSFGKLQRNIQYQSATASTNREKANMLNIFTDYFNYS